MKPRDFLNFFKTKSGKLVAFGAIFAAGLVIFSVLRKHQPSTEDAVVVTPFGTNAVSKPQVVQSVTRPMQVFNPPPAKVAPPASASRAVATNSAPVSPQPLPNVPPQPNVLLTPISLFADRADASFGGVNIPEANSQSPTTAIQSKP